MRKRGRYRIFAEILEIANSGEKKTHIMHRANLNYSQLSKNLDLLIKKGLLENTALKRKRQTMTLYKTTDKGYEYLENYRLIESMLQ